MLVYIDETGDHNLTHIQDSYPIFGLGALIISENEYSKMDILIRDLKISFFGSDEFIFHASELKRPVNEGSDKRNAIMLNPNVRKEFYLNLTELIRKIDFKIIACFVLKKDMINKYAYPVDPYYFSYENLLNRIIRYGDGFNCMYAEKRTAELDTELLLEHERLSKVGIQKFSAEVVCKNTKLSLINKKDNINGLQIIDLILSALAREKLGKAYKMVDNDLDLDTVHTKLVCPITVFP